MKCKEWYVGKSRLNVEEHALTTVLFQAFEHLSSRILLHLFNGGGNVKTVVVSGGVRSKGSIAVEAFFKF